MQSLVGRVGIVTGASSGIGAATARALAGAGMRLLLGARRGDALHALCEEIQTAGGNAQPLMTDLRDERQVDRLVDTSVERFGQLDAVVNNAAYGALRTIAEGRTDEWRAAVETNLLGTLMMCRAALRHMLPRRSGDILNVTSASAHEAWPYLSVYAATKAAVHTLSDGLRAEVAGQGIRVMTIEVHNVGGTDFASSFDPQITPIAVQRWVELGLLRRDSAMIEANDVAQAILFQLSQRDPASIHHVTIRSRAN
ncbi:MAG: SDR family oxidoreductase [Deltaproteobacteria bacterium]|nr:SDR family oxidoreductase [Deltaproteobacteria bacterium]